MNIFPDQYKFFKYLCLYHMPYWLIFNISEIIKLYGILLVFANITLKWAT